MVVLQLWVGKTESTIIHYCVQTTVNLRLPYPVLDILKRILVNDRINIEWILHFACYEN